MNITAIITSLLDNDFYKFLMQQVFFHRFSTASGEYVFKLRNKGIKLGYLKNELNQQLDALCDLKFTQEEIQFLGSLQINGVRIFKASYLHMLKNFKLDRENIHVFDNNGQLEIKAIGVLYEVMMFEIFVLAIVNELHFKNQDSTPDMEMAQHKFESKMERLVSLNMMEKDAVNPVSISDFGTRRRFSKEWQFNLIKQMKENYSEIFAGTSNVLLSKELGTMPIGTMAHEYLQAMQVLNTQGVIFSQKEALEIWLDEYRGILSVALTDVIGMESFLTDFDYLLSKAYDGTRHDSGDPVWWGDLQIAHYNKFNIDPKTKLLVFSDGLKVDVIENLYRKFCRKIKLSFGWGTNLTNDFGVETLNIVMKIVRCNTFPVVKISDSEGKTMCEDKNYIDYIKHLFGLKR
jgi:nicotinate phosphoribosyltransferase